MGEFACREVIGSLLWQDDYTLPGGANAALIRDRYLLFDVKDEDDEHFIKAKKGLYLAMQDALKRATDPVAGPYEAAYTRYLTSLGSSGRQANFATKGSLVLGLGSESVLETGITLHHTYGTPVIPGSAVKGLASHYCDQVRGATQPKFRLGQEYHKALFGASDDSGHIIFHDAWIHPDTVVGSLKGDIMTPHHADYYSGEAEAPTDFDKPVPISFLSIRGTFHVAVSCDVQDADGKKWEGLAFQILSDALKEWGIGGKTSAGYGRMAKVEEGLPVKKPASPERVTIAGRADSRPAPQTENRPVNSYQASYRNSHQRNYR